MPRRSRTLPKDRPLLFRVTSDLHAGSTVALCPPKVSLDDGGEYHASKAQQWLYERWQDFWKRGEAKRRELDAYCIDVFNGDATEGDHHKTTQILSGNPTAQASVVNSVLKVPLATKPDGLVFVRGTEAHVGPSAAFEERIALGLRKDGWPVIVDEVTGNASHWHWQMEHQGKRFDFAHHGKFGSRPSTKMNTVIALALDIFTEHKLNNMPHPDLAVRSHMHQFGDTGNIYPTRLIQMPAWQLKTAFVHRISTTGKLSDIGGILISVVDGRMDVEPIIYRPDSPTPYRL